MLGRQMAVKAFGGDRMWVQILRNKYLQSKTLAQVTVRPDDSPLWKGLMRMKVTFFQWVKFLVGNGKTTRFSGGYMARRDAFGFEIPFPI